MNVICTSGSSLFIYLYILSCSRCLEFCWRMFEIIVVESSVLQILFFVSEFQNFSDTSFRWFQFVVLCIHHLHTLISKFSRLRPTGISIFMLSRYLKGTTSDISEYLCVSPPQNADFS